MLVEGPALTAGRIGRLVEGWALETAPGVGAWEETGLSTCMGTGASILDLLGPAGKAELAPLAAEILDALD